MDEEKEKLNESKEQNKEPVNQIILNKITQIIIIKKIY